MIDSGDGCESVEITASTFVFNRVAFSTRIMPAERAAGGGDWCETFVVSGDVVACSIGDVFGHGVKQYRNKMRVREAVKSAALGGLDPAQTLASANRLMCTFDEPLLATACFALLDTARGTMTFASAGHPAPLVIERCGATYLNSAHADPPLGLHANLTPALRSVSFAPDSLLVLYTDGVTDVARHTSDGERQLLGAASFAYAGAIASVARVIENLMALTGCNADDASILTARIPGAATDREATSARCRSRAAGAMLRRRKDFANDARAMSTSAITSGVIAASFGWRNGLLERQLRLV